MLAAFEASLTNLDRARELINQAASADVSLEVPFVREESNRSQARERIQQLRTRLAQTMRTTLADGIPSGNALDNWKAALDNLDHARKLLDRAIPAPGIKEAYDAMQEEIQRHSEGLSTED